MLHLQSSLSVEVLWLNRLIKKSHLFMAHLSRLLLGVVNITMVSFGRQPWSGGKVYEDRKTAFVDRGFPSGSNPIINADSGLLQ